MNSNSPIDGIDESSIRVDGRATEKRERDRWAVNIGAD